MIHIKVVIIGFRLNVYPNFDVQLLLSLKPAIACFFITGEVKPYTKLITPVATR